MSSDSRVWVYQSSREFTNDEVVEIKEEAEGFIETWAAHGQSLKASAEIFHNRFIVIFVDEKQAMASGCSIDDSVDFIKEIETSFHTSLFDRMIIAYKQENIIFTCTLNEFEQFFAEGKINKNTIVFNNLVSTKSEFETNWKVPLKDSWHNQLVKRENADHHDKY